MIHPGEHVDALFPLGDRARVIKLLIASYVGFMLMYLFGFRATSSISISAIMTLPYGTSVTNTRSYIKKRILAQVIGVAVTYPLYLFFFIWAVDVIPPSPKWALSMTLSVAITAWINRKCKLKIADITMVIPGYLVLLMTPSYALYPIMRPIYVLLGIGIGYFLNVWFFAPHYGRILDQRLEEARHHLEPLLVRHMQTGHITASAEDLMHISETLANVDIYLQYLKQDQKKCAKYREYAILLPQMERQIEAHRAAVAVLQGLVSSEKFSQDFLERYRDILSDCFRSHLAIFEEKEPQMMDLEIPSTTDHQEIQALARLLEYNRAVNRNTQLRSNVSAVLA